MSSCPPTTKNKFRDLECGQQKQSNVSHLETPINWCQCDWLCALPSYRFHVLFNSLFGVLCNFPSQYLFAIGFMGIFSLRWCLSPTLRCTFKQHDSEKLPKITIHKSTGLAPSVATGLNVINLYFIILSNIYTRHFGRVASTDFVMG